MGGSSSKTDNKLTRSLSVRKSQKNSLQKIQRKLDKVAKDIHKFTGSIDDSKYNEIRKDITQIIDELEKISSIIKDKHKDLYQDILERCNHQLQRLDMKVTHASRPTSLPPTPSSPLGSPIASPLSLPPTSPTPSLLPPIESPLSERSGRSFQIKASIEEEPKVDKKIRIKSDSSEDEHDPQKDAVSSIDQMRRKIEILEEDIHGFKATGDKELYEQIKTALNQIIIKLDNMETYGNVQIKYERKLALQRAQECLKYLNDDSKPRNLQTQVTLEKHQIKNSSEINAEGEIIETRSKSPSYVRPVTLDLNANDSLKEELRQVIHKRIEEATEDDKIDGRIMEEKFDNSESDDDYDFVNVEPNDAKSAPVLVTNL